MNPESPAAQEVASPNAVVDAESTAPTGVDDDAEPSQPDISMASATTLSSKPETAASPDPSPPPAMAEVPAEAPAEVPVASDSQPTTNAAAVAATSTAEMATAPALPSTTMVEPAAIGPASDATAGAASERDTTHITEDPPVGVESAASETSAATTPCTPAPSTTDCTPAPSAPSPTNAGVLAHAAAEAVLERTVQRVESFLGELQKSMLALALRPEPVTPPPAPSQPTIAFDVAPLVTAMQAGLERSAQANAAVQAALTSLGERVTGVGERLAAVAEGASGIGTHVEHGMQSLDKTLQALQSSVALREPAKVDRVAPSIVVGNSDRMPTVLVAVAALVIAWSAVFWMKLGSPRLAIATLVGANLVSCCLLAGRHRRS